MSGRQRALLGAGITLVMAGGFLLAWAVAAGQAELTLLLIIPVVHGTGALMALSMLLIFVGLALTLMSIAWGTVGEIDGTTQEGAGKEWGGVILIGPIPIVFGSGRSLRGKWPLMALLIISSLLLLMLVLTALR